MSSTTSPLRPIRDADLDQYTRISSPDEIVQSDWAYDYDVAFHSGVPDPMDWSVDPEWVGKTARQASYAWTCFMRPIRDWQI